MRRLLLFSVFLCSLISVSTYASGVKGDLGRGNPGRPDDRPGRGDDRSGRDRDGRQYDEGYEAALQVCATLRFDSERTACLDAVRHGELFQVEATQVCRKLQFGSDAVQCIRTIARKRYLPTELSICSNSRFGSEVNSCLARTGRAIDERDGYDDYCDVDTMIRQVRNAKDLIGQRAPNRALRVLDRVEDQLLNCR
jgi:hypothetical protein